MTALKALRDDGWRVDEVKLREAMGETYDEKMGKDELRTAVSNLDIKDYGEAFLSDAIEKNCLKGPVVLQLLKYKFTNYPKIHDVVPDGGLFSVVLTDGFDTIEIIFNEQISDINGTTMYGSKILLTGEHKHENKFIHSNAKNCKFIGGTVEKRIEEYKKERFEWMLNIHAHHKPQPEGAERIDFFSTLSNS